MPDIDSLLEKATKKKFKKSTYRPWNYMDEIQKEEEEKHHHQEVANITELKHDAIPPINKTAVNIPSRPDTDAKLNISNAPSDNLSNVSIVENSQIKDKLNEASPVSPLYSILRLSGHQKIIFAFILERCLSRGLLSSGMITSEMLTSITNTSLSMVNTSIQRLVDKKLVSRENGKRGRGGFYCFSLSPEVKDAAIEYRRLATLDNTESSRSNESQIETFDSTRIDGRKFSSGLPKEWDELDVEPLQHIGFTRGHLVQLYKQGDLEAQSIQDSIYHFAYDLKYNNKGAHITKSSPIGYFMGILKRSAIYNAPDNYESPKDKALRELVERKKAEKEKREAMIKELINIAFEEWQAKLTQEEKDQFIPEEIRRGRLTGAKLASLKTYFTENVWPKLAPKEIDFK
jgi:hypothetical protein